MIIKKEIITRGDEKSLHLSLNALASNESNGMMRIYSAIGNFNIENPATQSSKKSNANVQTNKK